MVVYLNFADIAYVIACLWVCVSANSGRLAAARYWCEVPVSEKPTFSHTKSMQHML